MSSSLNLPEEEIVSTTNQSTPIEPGVTTQISSNLITLSSTVLLLSFLLPWANIFGGNPSGFDIQKNIPSYNFVWLLPALAALTILLNIGGLSTNLIRRVAGLSPLLILAYSANKLGNELFNAIAIGGWLALLGGAVLILIPSTPSTRKPNTPS